MGKHRWRMGRHRHRRWWWRVGTHWRRHSRGWGRSERGGELEDQSRPVLGVAESDRPSVMDEDRRHSHPVDVDTGFAAIDSEPLIAVEVQHHQGRRARPADTVEPDVRGRVEADGDVTARGKGVPTRAQPDDQGGPERCRQRSHPLSRPISRVESPLSSRHDALVSTVGRPRCQTLPGQPVIEVCRVAGQAPSRRAGGATPSRLRRESAGQRHSTRRVAARSHERDRLGPGSACACPLR